VVIRNCRIRSTGTYPIRNDAGNGASVLVEDTEIDGLRAPLNACGIYGKDWTARRCNIHHCRDGAKMYSNTRLEACFIHDLLVDDDGPHYDGVQIQGAPAGVSNIEIVGNAILNPNRSTSAVFIKCADGPISGVLVEGNLLNGGSYTVYNRDWNGVYPVGTRVLNNHFGRDYLYGPTLFDAPVEWAGNVWADTLEPM
jgi:hypothetical protein